MSDAEVLKRIYYDERNPASFGGVEKLWRSAKKQSPGISRKTVEQWLSGQDAYTLHRGINEKFKRRRTVVGGPEQQLQADLVDIRNHSSHNDGHTFILTAVDVFSRKAWAIPLKNKTGERVAEALERILDAGKFFSLQTDKGKEFYNEKVRSLLRERSIKHFSSENETVKASLVERFNRSLRARLHRSMTARGTQRILHVLPNIVEAYNSSYNRALGMSPNEVSRENVEQIHQRLDIPTQALPLKSVSESILRVGDMVRITKARGAFERGFTPNWSREIFRVIDVDNYQAPTCYRLADLSGEEILGIFYPRELQKVKEPETYAVEKVIRSRRVRGQKEFLVKWLGYPETFNSWVSENDMEDI